MPKGKIDFENLTFEDFRALAKDGALSPYEKIGFPDTYRADYEADIFADILAKIPALEGQGKRVLDIGPGCSELPRYLIDLCERQGHELVLVDSQEMLDLLPDKPFICKLPGRFPEELQGFVEKAAGAFDVIIAYSMLHYVVPGSDVFRFADSALALLTNEGRMLVGDIPNISKRKRFFASETGVRFHQQFMKTDERPEVHFNQLQPNAIDDGLLFGLLIRARGMGFDSYLLPQPASLPMANRREDLLFIRP